MSHKPHCNQSTVKQITLPSQKSYDLITCEEGVCVIFLSGFDSLGHWANCQENAILLKHFTTGVCFLMRFIFVFYSCFCNGAWVTDMERKCITGLSLFLLTGVLFYFTALSGVTKTIAALDSETHSVCTVPDRLFMTTSKWGQLNVY